MEVLDFENFLNERKVTLKRKYTEAYPAKHISTSARVRNAVLDAVADGVITEEELKGILAEIEAHKRWLSRNSSLFKIEEDEEGNIVYRLSKKGNKIRSKTRPVNESRLTSFADYNKED